MPEQFEILPETRPTPRMGRIRIEDISYNPIEPTADLRESVRRVGVLQSVALVESSGFPDLMFTVAAGRRRIRAAELAGLEFVPALVFPPGTSRQVAAAIALCENTHRRANPVTDYNAIREMMDAGASEQQIAHQLNIPLQTIRARLRLGGLIPPLRLAMEAGDFSATLGMRICRLPVPRQEQLLELLDLRQTLDPEARLTNADVERVNHVDHTTQLEAMPDDAFVQRIVSASDEETPLFDVVDIFPPDANDPVVSQRQFFTLVGINHEMPVERWFARRILNIENAETSLLRAVEEPAPAPLALIQPPLPENVVNREDLLRQLVDQSSWAGLALLLDAAVSTIPSEPDDDVDMMYSNLRALAAQATNRARQ